MGYDVTGLPAYVEQHKFDLIAASTAAGRTVSKVNVQTGVKGKAALNIIDSPVTLQADDCAFSPLGDTTFSQREIAVAGIKINEELCEKDLLCKYAQTMLRAGSLAEGESIVFEEEYTAQKMAKIAYALEISDWQGDTGGGDFYDGFLKIIDAAVGVVDGNTSLTTVATGITSANIIDLLWDMYKAAPEAVLEHDDVVVFVGNDVFRCYEQAIYNANSFHFNPAEADGVLPLVGASRLQVCAVAGLTGTDRMILARTSNLYIGMDLSDDSETMEMWYSQDNRVNRLAISFKRGTQIAFPDEIVEFTLVP